MAIIKDDKFNLIESRYKDGLSVREIAEELGFSIDAVYYFFRKHNIKRRSRSEARNILYDKQAPSYLLKSNLTIEEKELKIAGTMLYWAEGSKWKGEKIVDFANSNIDMIKLFLKFLRDICGINEKKLRVYLYCFKDQDIKQLLKFWSKETKIPIKQFTKPYIRKESDVSKKGRMKYGLVHIRYADKKLLNLIKLFIENYSRQFN